MHLAADVPTQRVVVVFPPRDGDAANCRSWTVGRRRNAAGVGVLAVSWPPLLHSQRILAADVDVDVVAGGAHRRGQNGTAL